MLPLERIAANWTLLRLVPEKEQTDEVCDLALSKSPYAIEHIHNQTRERCLKAVQADGKALYQIKAEARTDEINIAALKQNITALRFIEVHTTEICRAAIESDPFALSLLNPTHMTADLYRLALQRNFSSSNLERVPRDMLRSFMNLDDPAPKQEAKPAYVVIQEGGSSSELYVHSHESAEDAEDDRVSCSANGAYRTSPVLELPAALAQHGEVIYEFLEDFLKASRELECVEVTNREAEAGN